MSEFQAYLKAIPPEYPLLAISLAGLVLLLLLVLASGRGGLGRHRRGGPGLADLLNWGSVIEDGIILNKNGSLMAAWLYRGEDDAGASRAGRNAVSRRLNAALAQLGSGWMLHVDACRRPAAGYPAPARSHFPDPVSAAIDRERREFFSRLDTLYEGVFVVTATYFPPTLAQARLVELMFEEGEAAESENWGERALAGFKREIQALEGRLSSVFRLERLGAVEAGDESGRGARHDEFLRWLHYCLTGEDHPIFLPDHPAQVDSLVGGKDFTGGLVPLVGNRHIMAVAIDNFPSETSPGLLSRLAELPCGYRWSTRFIFLDPPEAAALIRKCQRRWRQKIRGLKDQLLRSEGGTPDHDARAMYEDSGLALAELNGGQVGMGLYTSLAVLMDEDLEKVKAGARQLQKALGLMGFPARIEDVNAIDAFFGSLPGHVVDNVRRSLLNTRHLSDLLPVSSIWTGREEAPCDFYPPHSPPLLHCLTTGSTPFRLNLHVRDLGHAMIFGPTGSGKSVLLAALAAQFLRYPGMSAYVFDQGRSLYTFCRAAGGRHFDLGA